MIDIAPRTWKTTDKQKGEEKEISSYYFCVPTVHQALCLTLFINTISFYPSK